MTYTTHCIYCHKLHTPWCKPPQHPPQDAPAREWGDAEVDAEIDKVLWPEWKDGSRCWASDIREVARHFAGLSAQAAPAAEPLKRWGASFIAEMPSEITDLRTDATYLYITTKSGEYKMPLPAPAQAAPAGPADGCPLCHSGWLHTHTGPNCRVPETQAAPAAEDKP